MKAAVYYTLTALLASVISTGVTQPQENAGAGVGWYVIYPQPKTQTTVTPPAPSAGTQTYYAAPKTVTHQASSASLR
jgi:hypothetical protein